jgi:hypothetical protein
MRVLGYAISRLSNYSSRRWLLLDSRVVDVPMVYHPTFVMLYSLKSFFVNGLKNESSFPDSVGASDPGIQ